MSESDQVYSNREVSEDPWIISTAKRNLKTGFLELHRSRAVFYALVKRELKSRYRGSIFGFAWALGKPISMLIVYSIIIGEILGASRSIEFFALYLFVGLMFWGFFSEGVVSATNSVVQASGLVQKIAFPREILPLTSVATAGVNLIIQIPVLIAGYLYFGQKPNSGNLLILIPAIGILFFLTIGLALFLSAINVYVRDIQPLTELIVMLLMYATPIIYSWTFVKEKVQESFGGLSFFQIYASNPLTAAIIGIQDALWPGNRVDKSGELVPNLFAVTSLSVWIMLFGSLLFMVFAYRVFLKLEPDFAREL